MRLVLAAIPVQLSVLRPSNAGKIWGVVGYLKRRRGQLILVGFLVTSLLLSRFPSLDLQISSVFFDGGFPIKDLWWPAWLHTGLSYFLWASMLFVVTVFVLNRARRRNYFGIDGKKVCYLFLVLIVGAGLVVNVILKDNFGRARPRDIEEFGGTKHFTPAFVVSRECSTNCSFSSGDAAGAFFSLALAMSLGRKRAAILAGLGLGAAVSLSRVATGAHFFSDTVVSFFIMLIVTDVLYYYMLLPEPDPAPAKLVGNTGLVEPD